MRSRSHPERFGRLPASAGLILMVALGLSSFLFVAPSVNARQDVGTGSVAAGEVVARVVNGGPASQIEGSQAVAGTDVNLVSGFAAMHYGTNGASYDSYSPPDVQVAVGPTEVVEMVNVHEQIFTKSGASSGIVPLSTVFNAGTDDIGDPRIVYDNTSQRFFAVVYDFTTQGVKVAISASSTVDAGWYHYSFNTPSTNICADQPYIGVSTDKVVVTANDYYVGTSSAPCRPLGSYAYQEYWVISKAPLLSNSVTYYYYYTFNSYYGMRPVSSGTSTAYIVCLTCTTGLLILSEVNGVPAAGSPPSVSTFYLPFAPPPAPPSAVHAGNTDLIDTNTGSGVEIQSTAWANSIWLTMNVGCTPLGDNTMRSCVGLVDVSVSPPQVAVSTTIYGPPGYYLFYPAITADSYGGIAIVAGYSSASIYPSVLVTGVKSGEPLGHMNSNLVTTANGTGYYCHYYRSSNLCRYGDYFGASPDPTDHSMMWFAGEYETANGWATRVSSLRMGLAAVTLSYSTQDGSNSPQTPSVSYSLQGAVKSGALSSSSTTFIMDLGTSWSAGSQLGGAAGERWLSSGNPGAQVSGDSTNDIVYYHQYLVTPTYTVSGGGSGYAPPVVTCTEYGSSATAASGSSVWVDAKSTCSFAQTLPGSKATERWAQASASVTVSGSGPISQIYYHQFLFTLSYSVVGGGAPAAPAFASAQFGTVFNPVSLASSPTGYWLDGGAAWSVDGTLGGSTGDERWVTSSAISGAVSQGMTASFAFQHQYHVSAVVAPAEGGVQTFTSGWYDSGTIVSLSAKASSGWQFEGWSGTGSGAFSGNNADASFALSGPANETALFYPGLTISALESGSVHYSFGTTQGTVSSGGTSIVYAPKGTTVTLTPGSSSFLYSFNGWSGALTGSASPGQVQLTGPSNVSASFGYNYTVIGGLVALAAVVVVGLASFLRRRSGGTARTFAQASAAMTQAQARFCANCGNPVSLQATFCNQCGNKMS